MKIATILFTYNRSYHTRRVLDGLRHNTVLPKKLYIFQDGLANKEDQEEWEKVNHLIKMVNWCDSEIVVAEENRGLSKSIVAGIDYAMEKNDAVIVLEDDCVPAPSFISFMEQCFDKYKADRRVYSVSGYAYPINIKQDRYDVYGCGTVDAWGWGTWKDRWNEYSKDYEILLRLRKEQESSKRLAIWGNDLEDMLIGNLQGLNDSWAVFWGLKIIEMSGICINPYISLIENIGMDGTGVHCGITKEYEVPINYSIIDEFKLPNIIEISEDIQKAFAEFNKNYTVMNEWKEDKICSLIYGKGKYFQGNEQAINEKYFINAIIDKRKKGWYAGKKIIRPAEIRNYEYDVIIIVLQNIYECQKIREELSMEYMIPLEKIKIWKQLYEI